ncbi:Allophanate hydrolase (plasmid) [Mycobacterium sp. THAF192]|nr:Allophanate hydrolase [Mycobacterium sp. THAF192]
MTRQQTPSQRVGTAYQRIAETNRPEVWIHLREQADVLADALEVERRCADGHALPLAGVLVAVKDNIDVAGCPTTAGCPEFTYTPGLTAVAITRLMNAGAIVLGKTNMDQFATGLVGTRSPYGAVRNALDPELVAGGSSAGSAVAVALGIADIGVGTDTAGSGRVPAALNRIVGVKPTLGIIPNHGVVPACADYDTITAFGTDLTIATTAVAIMSGTDPRDPRSRRWPADVRLAASRTPRIAIPTLANLSALSEPYQHAFEDAAAAAIDAGCSIETIDISELLDAARLLYDGAIVAERYAAVGIFLDGQPSNADPTVASIIGNARKTSGPAFAADLHALAAARSAAATLLAPFDALLLPTTTEHPTITAVVDDPIAINRRMGTFTNFCNLLDMAAVAFPVDNLPTGMPFGLTVVTLGFNDQIAVDIAARLTKVTAPLLVDQGVELAVFGAHLRGQPLHWQLEELGARYLRPVHTSDAYRLKALDTVPPKPGLVRTNPRSGAAIAGELYRLSEAGLGRFLAALPPPMALTSIELSDGRHVIGFTATHDATDSATDITTHRGWPAYLATLTP